MPSKEFDGIKRPTHFVDNDNLPARDKPAKIRPPQNFVDASLQKLGYFSEDLAIDKQTVLYF